ncbi:MAG: sulfatase [Paenibacillus sp.]|nr:sulfatase [Paenibacillus sp.]
MKKPNFIVIYCDDLGYGDLGCYGSKHVKTPHLDQLASQGVKLTNWYSNSPVCSPSRASLLTGKYPIKAGVSTILPGKRNQVNGLQQSEKTMAAVFREHGYHTALFGKWHLGTAADSRPNVHGFEEFYGFLAGCVDYYSHIFYWGKNVNPVHDLWHNEQEVWNDGRYLTEVITEKTVEYIARHRDEPFFAYVAYNSPHFPMHAPEKYMQRYAHLPWDRQVMAAMISAVDDGVGDIVRVLKEHGLYDDTVIFFSSDNGPSTEARNWLDGTEDLYYGGSAGIFRGHKASLYDGGIKEPALLSYPSYIRGGQVCEELGVMMDVLPTFLELAEIDASASPGMDGTSIVSMIKEGKPSPHEKVFWEYAGQLAVREGNWKLVLDGKLDFGRKAPEQVHLADLSKDPGERVNLAEQYPEIAGRLEQAVREWYQSVKKETPSENPIS